MHPNEIDLGEAQADAKHAQDLWNEAGDEQAKYDEANAAARVAEEKIASAQGKH